MTELGLYLQNNNNNNNMTFSYTTICRVKYFATLQGRAYKII